MVADLARGKVDKVVKVGKASRVAASRTHCKPRWASPAWGNRAAMAAPGAAAKVGRAVRVDKARVDLVAAVAASMDRRACQGAGPRVEGNRFLIGQARIRLLGEF
jgi:uncharacterized NAD-dependent epimerase/dehydratase family protein